MLLSQSNLLVATFGSGIANAVFMPPGSSIVEIFEESVLDRPVWYFLAIELGLIHSSCSALSPPRSLRLLADPEFGAYDWSRFHGWYLPPNNLRRALLGRS